MHRVVLPWVALMLAVSFGLPLLATQEAQKLLPTPRDVIATTQDTPQGVPEVPQTTPSPAPIEPESKQSIAPEAEQPGSAPIGQDQLASNLEALQQQLAGLQAEFRSSQGQLLAVSAENQALKTQLAALHSEISGLQQKLPGMQAENTTLKSLVLSIGAGYTSLKGQLATDTAKLTEVISNLQKNKAEKTQISALANEHSLNRQRLSAFAMQTSFLNGTVSGLTSTIRSHTDQLGKLKTASIAGLNSVMSYDANSRVVTFKAVNVRIVNGQGATATVNGLGNLLIGYTENPLGAYSGCQASKPPIPTNCVKPLSASQHSGSHNLVLGYNNSYTQYSSIIGGVLQP